MSNFNPQFSVTQARADYSGIIEGGRAIANGIAMFAQKKRQEEEQTKEKKAVIDFLGTQAEEMGLVDMSGKPVDVGMIEKAYEAGGPQAAQAWMQGIAATNQQRIKEEQQARIASAVNAIGPDADPNKVNSILEGFGLKPQEMMEAAQKVDAKIKQQLDAQKVQEDIAVQAKQGRIDEAEAQYGSMNASPAEWRERDPNELMQGFNKAEQTRTKNQRADEELELQKKRVAMEQERLEKSKEKPVEYKETYTDPATGETIEIEVVRGEDGKPYEKRTGLPLTQLFRMNESWQEQYLNPSVAAAYGIKSDGAAPAAGSKKPLTPELAKSYIDRANGDKDEARKLAAADGYTF